MATYSIKAPDGNTYDIEGPEGATDEQVRSRVLAAHPEAAGRRAAPPAPMDVDPTGSFLENAAAGAGGRAMDLYRGTKQLLNIGDQPKLQAEIDEAKRLDQPLKSTGGGILGGGLFDAATFAVPGGAVVRGAGMVPKLAQAANAIKNAGALARGATALGSGVAGGAAQSAFEPIASDETRLGTTLLGAAGGGVGNLAVRGLGKLITPFGGDPARNQMVRQLLEEKIPISAGQATGSKFIQGIEGGMASIPGVKSLLIAGSDDQKKAYTKAIARRLGANVDELTPEVMGAIDEGLGRQFEKVAGAAPQPRSQAYATELANLVDEAVETQRNLGTKTAPGQEYLEAAMQRNMDVPEVTGQAYNRVRSDLTKEASRLARAGDPAAATARAVRELEDKEAQRLFGEAAGLPPTWRAWGQFKNLESPGVLDPEGLVNPGRLASVVGNKNRSAMASGTGDEYLDFIRAGKLLKPASEGSTTARNLMVTGLLAGGGVGAGYSAYQDPVGAATKAGGGVLALLATQTPTGRKLLTNSLMNTERGRLIADFLGRGATGAGAGYVENKQ